MASTEQLQTWLSEAETARHKLVTGTKEVRVDYQGRSVTYTEAKISELDNYIRDLKSQIAVASGSVGRGRAIRVSF